MTQKEQVKAHLTTHGKITDREAYLKYGIRRLGARIYDLRQDGMKIVSEPTREKNRFGVMTQFATYRVE